MPKLIFHWKTIIFELHHFPGGEEILKQFSSSRTNCDTLKFRSRENSRRHFGPSKTQRIKVRDANVLRLSPFISDKDFQLLTGRQHRTTGRHLDQSVSHFSPRISENPAEFPSDFSRILSVMSPRTGQVCWPVAKRHSRARQLYNPVYWDLCLLTHFCLAAIWHTLSPYLYDMYYECNRKRWTGLGLGPFCKFVKTVRVWFCYGVVICNFYMSFVRYV